jgi:serine/threonine-protein kinase
MVERIGHYRIVAELGRGGMGIVYKAHEESLNRFVAIKVLGEHLIEDPSHVERFLREAQSAASLNHPNIVQIYAVSEEEGQHYFVMEYVSGQSLQQILRTSGPLRPVQVARIAIQTAAGLQAAHERGIVHRDIKPANLLIDDRGLVKIADFGLALMGGAVSRLTATGMFMGTPGYLSPEQCLDQGVDHRTDIYSLGVTLFEALSGNAPFTADSPLALLRQIVEVEPPDLGELKPEVDVELRDIVASMMVKDRDSRLASCSELVAKLGSFLDSKGASGNLVERLVSAKAGGPQPPPPPPADDGQLDSQPTVAVSGEQADTGDPAAPTVATDASIGRTEAPVVETSPLDAGADSGGGRRLAIAAALVIAFGLAAVVTASFIAWRTGLFEVAKAGVEPEATTVAETPPEDVTPFGADAVDSEEGEPATAGGAAGTGSAETSTEESLVSPAQPMETGDDREDRESEAAAADPGPVNTHKSRDIQRHVQPPPPTPLPQGTIVIAVGDPLFAGEAEAYVEEALNRAGIPVVDENGIPGAADLIAGAGDREPGEMHRILQPYARNAVMVRVDYLGERPLMYMGQRDLAFQARVTVVPIDLHGRQPLAQPMRTRVEYTHLSAQRVVEEKLRAPTRRLVQILSATSAK